MIGKILTLALVFVIGFLSCMLISFMPFGQEMPFSLGSNSGTDAPGDWIGKDQIHVYDNAIVIDVNQASLSSYAASGSMKPVLDKDSNGIRIVPKSAESINVGDIITYEKANELIVHRVVDKGKDELGDWFVARGDNNNMDDGKIRFSEIKYVTIGILY